MVRVCSASRAQRRWACVLAFLALFTGLAPWAAAQTDVTTSRISGSVEDADGSPLPGVTVTASNTETGLQVTGVTDERGFYRLLNLPTGTYTLEAVLDGFATATAENVRLLLGSTPTVNFNLQSSAVAETITVTAEVPVVEVTNTASGTTIQQEQIEALPVSGRDFKGLVLLTPQTRLDSERGNLSISGQRGINTNVTIDGVDYNNAFFGGTVGGAEGRAPLSISQESIKEFTVITNGASVEFGRSGGGFVNVITKSGTNNMHGSAFYYQQPESLISDFADGREPADQDKEQYGGSLGGAIVQDRVFYFLSYDNQDQSLTVPIAAGVLDPDIFARYPILASPDNYVQTRDGSVAFGRLDFQASSAHRLMVRGNFTDYEGINGTSDSQTRTASYNGIEGLNSDSYVGSWSGQFGANLLNDLNLNYIEESTPRADKGLNLPEIQLGGFRYGEVSFLPIDPTITERKAFGDTVTFLAGDHVVKGGAEYNDTSIDQVFRGNWRGVFIFNNEADFLAGRWNEYRQFGGLGGLTSIDAGRASFGQKEEAIFFQDQWFVRQNLTLQAGLRFESLDNPNDPVLNRNDRNADGSFRLNGEIPDMDLTDQISPRLGLSWAPDEKTAVRFSVGRFWSRTPAILLAQLFTSNGLRGTQYNIFSTRDSAGNVIGAPNDPLAPGWGANFNPEGVERIDFTKVPNVPRPGVFIIDEGFENPYTDRLTLGAEREVFSKMALALDFTYAEGHQLQRLTNINRVYDGTTAANGVPRYSSTTPFPYYGRIVNSVSDGESEYTALTATLRRRYADNFSLYGSVTYSRDKDDDSNERNFSGIQAEDYNDLDLNWGYSNRDQRWRGVINGLWDTPWWGIGLSGAFRYTSGSPYTAFVGADVNNDGESGTDRPTVNGVHFERNSFRQPDYYSLDLRLAKDFNIGPGDLSLFAECFNCTDAENRFVTDTRWGTGQDPRPQFGQEVGVGTPRIFQLALRYDF
ncbi:MAG TPA: TonB-dependent receptor [Thermoanaerobaculia bacterium]|nr:TonB-dependent receptor [Thermoanaerobaculia bacterium]